MKNIVYNTNIVTINSLEEASNLELKQLYYYWKENKPIIFLKEVISVINFDVIEMMLNSSRLKESGLGEKIRELMEIGLNK